MLTLCQVMYQTICMQSCQYIVVMGSTAEHQADGRIVIIIMYGINAIELLLAHTTHVHTSIDNIGSHIYITYLQEKYLTVFI